MNTDYSFKILESFLLLKKYENKEEVIQTCAATVSIVCQDDRFSPAVKNSYKEALRKLNTLSYNEMNEIIDILKSHDEGDGDIDSSHQKEDNIFDDGTDDYNNGVKYYKEKEYKKAFTSFCNASRKGHAKAQHSYGLCMYYGLGTTVDRAMALKQFVAASSCGVKESDMMINYILNEQKNGK